MSGRAVVAVLTCAAVLGCSRKENKGATAGPSVSADASVPPDALAPEAEAAPRSTGAPSASAPASFAGRYGVSVGSMYVPAAKDWASVKFKNDESKLLGDGDVTLAFDGTGRVSGATTGGPLGASVIDGMTDGKSVRATIRRKDPTDGGLTGTLTATLRRDTLDTLDTLEGSMRLAEFNAAVVRVATLRATRK